MKKYPKIIEQQMKNFYNSLPEKDRRRYAGIEATKLGRGGISYICKIFECDYSGVSRGQKELTSELDKNDKRQRVEGGGRKSILSTAQGLDEAFIEIVVDSTAGSPMDENIKWTNLSRKEIANRLAEKGFNVGVNIVRQLLEKHNFRKRQAFKTVSGKEDIDNRDEQFINIKKIQEDYHEQGHPVLSMDVKKKS
ncbi:MAG: hypothetical protein KAU90_04975, partial [Sulfurovaceae bacterium]|nr:hypothetical protein [Sulfurovaceae bacterium]